MLKNILISGSFGFILLSTLEDELLDNVLDQIYAESLDYTDFNNLGKVHIEYLFSPIDLVKDILNRR